MDAGTVHRVLEEYLSKITGFAYLKTNSKHDADDLAQDIVYELVKSLAREQGEINYLPAYIYRICNNVFYKRIRQSKKVSYIELTGLEFAEDYNFDACLYEEDIERDILSDTQGKQNPRVLLCIKTARGSVDVDGLTDLEKQAAADAIKYGLVKRSGELLKPNFIFIPKDILGKLEDLCVAVGEELLPLLREIVEEIKANFKERTPENIWNQIVNFSSVDFRSLTPMLLDDLYRAGELSEPCEDDKHILSYYIWR